MAIVARIDIFDDETGMQYQVGKVFPPSIIHENKSLGSTRYDFHIAFNILDEAMKRPDSFGVTSKEERIKKLKGQLSIAGDRRDWDECERLEKELEELEGKDDGLEDGED